MAVLLTKFEAEQVFYPWGFKGMCILLVLILRQQSAIAYQATPNKVITIPNFEYSELKSGVFKFKNEEAILYLKPPIAPYKSDHNPMICWQGSGYSFKKVEKIDVNNLTINLAELVKKEDKLFTAWWFESPYHRTGDQWHWRAISFKNNEDFYLVNLTCNSKQEIIEQIQMLTEKNLLIYGNL